MHIDVYTKNRDLKRYGQKSSFDAFFWAAFSLLLLVAFTVFFREANAEGSELELQARRAANDTFSSLAGAASPFWYMSLRALYALGVPLAWSAAALCTAYKLLGFLLVQRIVYLYLIPEANAKLATLAALILMCVSAVRIPSLNPGVFAGVGSPTVWHDPAQILGQPAAILCLFYAAHCVFRFRELRGQTDETGEAFSWKQAGVLAALLLLAALCKTDFLRAFLPALGLYFLVLWIRNPKHWRCILPMLLSLLPAAVYIILRYSGADGFALSLSLTSVWLAVRNMLMMAAFPLLVLLFVPKKDSFRDPVIALCLLLTAFGAAHAALFGQISAEANWAGMTAAFLLWIVMLPRFIDVVFTYRFQRLRLLEDARRGAIPAAALARKQTRLNLQSLGILAGIILLLWQLYSGLYSLYILYSTGGIL